MTEATRVLGLRQRGGRVLVDRIGDVREIAAEPGPHLQEVRQLHPGHQLVGAGVRGLPGDGPEEFLGRVEEARLLRVHPALAQGHGQLDHHHGAVVLGRRRRRHRERQVVDGLPDVGEVVVKTEPHGQDRSPVGEPLGVVGRGGRPGDGGVIDGFRCGFEVGPQPEGHVPVEAGQAQEGGTRGQRLVVQRSVVLENALEHGDRRVEIGELTGELEAHAQHLPQCGPPPAAMRLFGLRIIDSGAQRVDSPVEPLPAAVPHVCADFGFRTAVGVRDGRISGQLPLEFGQHRCTVGVAAGQGGEGSAHAVDAFLPRPRRSVLHVRQRHQGVAQVERDLGLGRRAPGLPACPGDQGGARDDALLERVLHAAQEQRVADRVHGLVRREHPLRVLVEDLAYRLGYVLRLHRVHEAEEAPAGVDVPLAAVRVFGKVTAPGQVVVGGHADPLEHVAAGLAHSFRRQPVTHLEEPRGDVVVRSAGQHVVTRYGRPRQGSIGTPGIGHRLSPVPPVPPPRSLPR
ncbi:hypothetical protein AB0K09_14235 [Streptomyces sp. NPDC049577]|uniref:hypothetical protein n=1 Tax=Streptomyces sp. NPDC049577 TaxID=3155153 RepID=UPI00343C00FC